MILAVYGQVKGFDFVDFDDALYVVENPKVKAGLTPESISWAFLFQDRTYRTCWHPLTWLSHMLDIEVFGLDPGWHHLSGLSFHVVNSLLLFVLFKQMTGARWRSAFAAALFALHPLNVESVAWVAERKNVLSTFFWLLTIQAYMAYTARPRLAGYLLVVLIFLMGLMAKPMLVTLPFVLLLLDYWPLERLQPISGTCAVYRWGRVRFVRSLLEKIPFLILAVVTTILSTTALRSLQTVIAIEQVPLGLRLANALVSCVKYIVKMFWPLNLAYFYPYPDHIDGRLVGGALILLAGTTLAVLRLAPKRPYLAFGWFWYLGTLVPVSGVFQAGLWPEMADRWAYVPLIGLYVMLAWGAEDVLARYSRRRVYAALLAGFILIGLSAASWRQLQSWRNSKALFSNAIAVTGESLVAHVALGAELEKRGRIKEAIGYYRQAMRMNPDFIATYVNLGGLLARQGRFSEAIAPLRKALALNPRASGVHFNLAKIYAERGNSAAALHHYSAVVRLEPGNVKAYNNLGNLLAALGRSDDAIRVYSNGLKVDPDNDRLRSNLKKILEARQRQAQKLRGLTEALKQKPRDYRLQTAAGSVYEDLGQWDQAIRHYQAALKIDPRQVETIRRLGLVHAFRGDYERARQVFKKELAIQPNVWWPYYFIAGTYARQNRKAESVRWLKTAVEKGFDNLSSLSGDQNFDNIRDTSYYLKLVPSS